MKTSRFLLSVALLPLGCVQGAQNPPPPAATPEAAAAASDPAVQAPPSAATGVPPATTAMPGSANPAVPSSGSAPAAAEAPRPAPIAQGSTSAPPAPVRLVVPAGTLLPIEFETTVSSDASREGDSVQAVLTEDVALQGFTLDRGAEVRGRVLTAVAAKRVKGRARLAVAFDAVMENGERLAIHTEPIDTMADSTSSKDKKIIGGSAVGGLILGAIKDGKKGAVIGTVIGAAAGTGAVLIMKGDEVEIPRGARLTIAVTR